MLQAEQLAMEFQRQFKNKYNRYPYSLKNVKNTKWWVHFERLQNESKLPLGSERKFIQKLFDEWDDEAILYPYVLSQKKAKDVESLMLNVINSDLKGGLQEVDFIKMTLNRAKQWCESNNITDNQIKAFLEDSTCIQRAHRGEFYQPLFYFSKPYVDKYGVTEEEALKKNSIRAFQKNVYDILKKSLGENFID